MTKIEWCNPPGLKGEGWPLVTGCTPASPGCANCWAARQASGRLRHQRCYKGLARDGKWTGEVRLNAHLLDAPLRWRDPRCVFPCHTGDLFHPDVPFEFIAQAFAVMARCPQHAFLVLTKRPDRMCRWFSWAAHLPHNDTRAGTPAPVLGYLFEMLLRSTKINAFAQGEFPSWPLTNVALGTSIEDQQRADERTRWLLQCRAAMLFISVEPMLGAIDLSCVKLSNCPSGSAFFSGPIWHGPPDGPQTKVSFDRGVGWAIVGCESGPRRRPCKHDWVEDLLIQCRSAGVPVFIKQASVDSRVSHDPAEWPEWARVQQWPKFLQLDGKTLR